MIDFLKNIFVWQKPLIVINNNTNDKDIAKQLGGNYCQD